MSTVQLPDGQQIERGGKNPHPSGASDRMQQYVGGADVGENNPFKESLDSWNAEDQFAPLRNSRSPHHLRCADANHQCWYQYCESRQRSRDADVEERLARVDG